MNTKYAVYNPTTGKNIFFGTKEEAILNFWGFAINIARSHFHNTAYMVVETNEDGVETWYNDENQEIERPKTEQELLELYEAAKAAS
jgi:hypothetical protein